MLYLCIFIEIYHIYRYIISIPLVHSLYFILSTFISFFLMLHLPSISTLFSLTMLFLFFFNDTAPTEIYTLSLHDALPIATPIPGSFVSTRSSRRPAAAVPSATLTCPAWSEFPMPTPPPWWNATHAAPDAVFSRALRIAQSAIASEPSRIPSVSRNGDATEPVSRWSRPITTGAPTSPCFTRSLSAQPNAARSPCPSQQMRAGNPWKATRSPASRIQRARCSFSGNSSHTKRSVRRISFGSPLSATQRNGPLPSQNRGRMYSGAKPGVSNAAATPASLPWGRMVVP